MTIKKYIKNRKVTHFRESGIEVFIKDPTSPDINVQDVVMDFVHMIPAAFLGNIDSIYVGSFPEFKDRNIQALYKDSSIYVTNLQPTEEDMLSDLVHETAHALEEVESAQIYADGSLEGEYLIKRKKLWASLDNYGIKSNLKDFLELDFDESFDKFLYLKVGYPTLASISANIFYSPYAATSIREYFANGFEAYFVDEDVSRLRSLSPVLFDKIQQLTHETENFEKTTRKGENYR